MRCTGAPQTGHGCLNRPCTAILVVKRGHLLGKPAGRAPRCSRSTQAAASRRVALVQAAISSSDSDARQLERREPRGMKDLVRVGVADAAEQVRIGQAHASACGSRASALRGTVRRRLERLETAGIERRSAARPRTSCSDARFFEPASVKSSVPFENSSDASSSFRSNADLLARFPPAQPARDHQMQTRNSSARGGPATPNTMTMRFPMRRDVSNDPAVEGVDWWIDRPQHERASQAAVARAAARPGAPSARRHRRRCREARARLLADSTPPWRGSCRSVRWTLEDRFRPWSVQGRMRYASLW